MGCNCKQAPTIKKPNVVRVNGVNTITEKIPLPYTRENLNRCNDYFISRIQSDNEKNWVIDFHNEHFDEQFPHGYSGDGWLRIKKRIDHLRRQLDDFENN
jgi:nicotinamide mononucleotide adenylyltransferase